MGLPEQEDDALNLKELVDAASRLDPNVQVTVHDSTTYAVGKRPERHVTASVFSRTHGEGSHEAITIQMMSARQAEAVSDQVAAIVPGGTTLYWQADPLVRALDRDRAQSPRDRVDVTN